MSALRNFAYKTLTNKAFATRILLAELLIVALLGYGAIALEAVASPLAFAVKIACAVLAFFVTLDALITAFVVFTGKIK